MSEDTEYSGSLRSNHLASSGPEPDHEGTHEGVVDQREATEGSISVKATQVPSSLSMELKDSLTTLLTSDPELLKPMFSAVADTLVARLLTTQSVGRIVSIPATPDIQISERDLHLCCLHWVRFNSGCLVVWQDRMRRDCKLPRSGCLKLNSSEGHI